MTFAAAGSPITAFVDAFRVVLLADTRGSEALMSLVTGVYGHLPGDERVPFPYLVIGRRTGDNEGGAMQRAGGRVSVQLDGWSDAKGPYPMQRILSRVLQLMERRAGFRVSGFEVLAGSLTCEFQEIFDEPELDQAAGMPERRLYHGVQRWVCEIHQVV